jgi:hypothetical protein
VILGFIASLLSAHRQFSTARNCKHTSLDMEPANRVQLDQFGSTALRVQEEGGWVMDRIENYFLEVGASVEGRKQFSIKAEITHPDGFAVRVSAKYYPDVEGDHKIVDILRRSGDALLFNIVYHQLRAYILGHGEWPELFYDGQLCPRVIMKALPPQLELPAFRLDPGGEKRKFAEEPDP